MSELLGLGTGFAKILRGQLTAFDDVRQMLRVTADTGSLDHRRQSLLELIADPADVAVDPLVDILRHDIAPCSSIDSIESNVIELDPSQLA